MGETFSIGDLAAEFDVTTRTLRFYEEKGLLCPQRNGQARTYDAADRARLRLILRGKRLGFSLQESAEIIAMYDPATDNKKQLQALLAKIREKKQRLQAQQQDLESMIRDLRTWERRSRRYVAQLDAAASDTDLSQPRRLTNEL
ncbi:MAG: MerR family DNA-binding transcriptional regulator [Pseudomonadota bacterium]